MLNQDNTRSRRCSMTTKSPITRESTGLSTATPPRKWTDYVSGTGPGFGGMDLDGAGGLIDSTGAGANYGYSLA